MHNVKVEIDAITYPSINLWICKNSESYGLIISLDPFFIMEVYNSAFSMHLNDILGGNI